MNNQKGEVVIAVMVVLMVGMMLIGRLGTGHGCHGENHGDSVKHEHSEKEK